MTGPTAFDLVILNGRVLDRETGLDAVRRVGVSGDRIAAVTDQPIQGDEASSPILRLARRLTQGAM